MKPNVTNNPLDSSNFRNFEANEQEETVIGKTALGVIDKEERKNPSLFTGFETQKPKKSLAKVSAIKKGRN